MAWQRIGMVVAGVLAAGVAEAQDDVLGKAMSRNPDRFEAQAIDLIAGFGGADGLRADGIETHIALERAGARASAMRRFLAMDLDADGSVTRSELAVVQAAASAQGRGRMERQFTAADAGGDGELDAAEIAAAGTAAGLSALDEGQASVLRALLRLDGDGNGALTVAEITAAVAQMGNAG